MAELNTSKDAPFAPPPIAADPTENAALEVRSNAPHRRAHDGLGFLAPALDDAERLLKYAAESGFTVDDQTRNSILAARAATGGEWDEKAAANLLAALTKLAAQLK